MANKGNFLIFYNNELGKKTPDVYVTADGVKTYSALLDELNALIDYDKINPKSVVIGKSGNNVDVLSISEYSATDKYTFFGAVRYSANKMIQSSFRIVSSGSNIRSTTISTNDGTTGYYNSDSTVPSSGKIIGIIY